jgi:hypothetical protein
VNDAQRLELAAKQLQGIARDLPPSKFPDPCEWDPDNDTDGVVGQEHAPAELIVGANGEWRLCKPCAELPRFARYTVRKKITTPPPWVH